MANEIKELKVKAEHWMGMDHSKKRAFEAWKAEKEFRKTHAAGQEAPRKHNAWWCKSCGLKCYLYKSCYNHECAANSTIAHWKNAEIRKQLSRQEKEYTAAQVAHHEGYLKEVNDTWHAEVNQLEEDYEGHKVEMKKKEVQHNEQMEYILKEKVMQEQKYKELIQKIDKDHLIPMEKKDEAMKEIVKAAARLEESQSEDKEAMQID